ncbi:hypothetical protein BJY52DRAFT_1189643 [Lactarius psammicola]|nr:hypothetical protein BJY52DRAFT_1189643 [Lactarius psammicola]
MAAYEKQEVGPEEKRKHADSEAEKLKKSLQDNENTYNDALCSIQENSAKVESEKKKAERYEEELRVQVLAGCLNPLYSTLSALGSLTIRSRKPPHKKLSNYNTMRACVAIFVLAAFAAGTGPVLSAPVVESPTICSAVTLSGRVMGVVVVVAGPPLLPIRDKAISARDDLSSETRDLLGRDGLIEDI